MDKLYQHREEQVKEFLKKYGEYEVVKTNNKWVMYQNNTYEITIMLFPNDSNHIMGGVKGGTMVSITELDKYPISYLFNQIDKDIKAKEGKA